ncbi:hypothetical protein RS130_05000 [Paraglaciecola aquimarina]|uniref:Uncharacterized protein n=1 Tax=Paraglaciecola aquimarina TaxID=1235557 RepID=A0ABU3STP1_9ALTE|nr:hypothetical protein [Paraglaciecola aquimarina]MDU0353372.1 hypothetical protein [Paraglaciecola aquimarina]
MLINDLIKLTLLGFLCPQLSFAKVSSEVTAVYFVEHDTSLGGNVDSTEIRRSANKKQKVLTLAMVREESKPVIQLSPSIKKQPKRQTAIAWSVFSPYIENNMLMSVDEYKRQVYVLGNHAGAVRYETDDLVLSSPLHFATEILVTGRYQIVRAHQKLYDLQGKLLGLQIEHIAKVDVLPSQQSRHGILKISQSLSEVKPW